MSQLTYFCEPLYPSRTQHIFTVKRTLPTIDAMSRTRLKNA